MNLNTAKRGVGFCYRRAIRPFLPVAGPVRYAGVAISRDRKVGDLRVGPTLRPWDILDIPDYEAGLARGIAAHVRPGDKVVIVGGGEGVTVVLAARAAGDSGTVVCFEGAKSYFTRVVATAERNGFARTVEVRNAIVGEAISVYGGSPDFAEATLKPEDIPECDVLELDCEGAEKTILSRLRIRPRTILVETHGHFDSPTAAVQAQLEELGYEVADLGWAEPSRLEECQRYDVRVLAGQLKSAPARQG